VAVCRVPGDPGGPSSGRSWATPGNSAPQVRRRSSANGLRTWLEHQAKTEQSAAEAAAASDVQDWNAANVHWGKAEAYREVISHIEGMPPRVAGGGRERT
jgi:hypothetical protein